jgi:hypothetical protein
MAGGRDATNLVQCLAKANLQLCGLFLPGGPGGFAYAARWITKARYRDVVRYRTRNRFDLRRRNLRLMTVKGIV